MKGYRTLILNYSTFFASLGAIWFELLADPAIQAILPENMGAYALAFLAAVNIVMRHLTTGPVGEK